MDLKSGYPFWAVRHGLGQTRKPLIGEQRCDLLIIGGGITGALFADRFTREGHDVIVVEKRDLGWGSTSASTALLQYEIDTPMVDLAKRYDETQAVAAYRACLEAIDALVERAAALDVEHHESDSLYLASKKREVPAVSAEYALRLKHGFPVSWLGPSELKSRFGAKAPGGLLSEAGAWVDPYAFALALLDGAVEAGARVHDRTTVAKLEPGERGVVATTGSGCQIRASRVVIASGYESQRWLDKKVADNRSSYAFATDHDMVEHYPQIAETMVWESARPYFYLRSTGDGRFVAGGEDDAIDLPARRDARVDAKASKIAKRIKRFLPELALNPVWAWGGTFAETFDGLPFFGPHEQWGARVYFAMAYGGNGITFSQIGTDLLAASLAGREHSLAPLFSFSRLERR